MRPARIACALIALAFFVEISAPASGAPIDPINLSVAKKRSGPYKSAVLDPDSPPDNPQIVRKKNDLVHATRFFFKVKNRNDFGVPVQLVADDSTSDFTVTYTVGGLNITPDLNACHAYAVPAKSTALIVMTLEPTGATAGDTDFWGLYTLPGGCAQPVEDAVFAEVNVPL